MMNTTFVSLFDINTLKLVCLDRKKVRYKVLGTLAMIGLGKPLKMILRLIIV